MVNMDDDDETNSAIRKLNEDSIRRIVAEQAITDLSSIVKELVDNAIDAESTTIKIRLCKLQDHNKQSLLQQLNSL